MTRKKIEDLNLISGCGLVLELLSTLGQADDLSEKKSGGHMHSVHGNCKKKKKITNRFIGQKKNSRTVYCHSEPCK